MRIKITALLVGIGILLGCTSKKSQTGENPEILQEVNVYTHRHYPSDQQLFADFTKQTGINVNVVNASADELLKRLELEGEQSPADVLITVDVGRLHRAKTAKLLQVINSQALNRNIPQRFRDPEGTWYGLTYRARVIVYSKDRVNPDDLSTYEDLADSRWTDRVLVRSSGNIYNQSLLASILAVSTLSTLSARPMRGTGQSARRLSSANSHWAANMLPSCFPAWNCPPRWIRSWSTVMR